MTFILFPTKQKEGEKMKPKNSFLMIIVVGLSLVAGGCASGGMFTAANLTDVRLQSGNYKILARGVTGEATAGYLFGVTVPAGMVTNTIAIARVDGTGMLYKEALDGLWKNFQATNGPAEGKRLALVNVHYDSDALNLLVYTHAKLMITADVVEFTE
jgi:Family of unknown function (DUF6567)